MSGHESGDIVYRRRRTDWGIRDRIITERDPAHDEWLDDLERRHRVTVPDWDDEPTVVIRRPERGTSCR